MHPGENINIEDFNYDLPAERIAQFPLAQRDHSRLLVYKDKQITRDFFNNIKNHLPEKSLLVLNDSKVIHARLLFKKESGAVIEIFCLNPVNTDQQSAFLKKENCEWICLVGNNKRWKSGKLSIDSKSGTLFAEKTGQQGEIFIIRFSWQPAELGFGEVLNIFGKVPLPPYINRNTVDSDDVRYQTVFANKPGSVAAPTAGLHFTEQMLKEINKKGIQTSRLTLHVGAGTFKPVTSETIAGHEMHDEHFSVSREFLQTIIQQIQDKNAVIPVGTTSARTLESLYWMGVKAILKNDSIHYLDQWEPYELKAESIHAIDSLSALLENMDHNNIASFEADTRMIIVPGYDFKIANGIITNFHQPRSTLLLLVAAMIGEKWKDAYRYALVNDFRFLSYGDCCLIL